MDTPRVSASLAAEITHTASLQTYYTIQTLVPEARRFDALRAYAYFRWVDDMIDGDACDQPARVEFLNEQKELLYACLEGRAPVSLRHEEWMLVDLVQGPLTSDAGLRIYLTYMMDVMEYDTHRRNRRLTQKRLNWYSRRLATAVTEAVFTFIGESAEPALVPQRYDAADAAHIVHMLRDLCDDLDVGYNNIPVEIIPGDRVLPSELDHPRFKNWVRSRIETAKYLFAAGRRYLQGVENSRCRIAGALYEARFQGVIAAIENEGYTLRRDYSDCMGPRMQIDMAWNGLRAGLTRPLPVDEYVRPSEHIRPA